ncbi:hypothetical protein [Bradyrhizobium sp. C9]|uniref:hypothetical protein n=1 Tax=Bradyrhizobium sp. C9 TaxID=142585 RepID=UPI000BE86729|nr:hypothetical protein [Bradyrhizobium sp. C9]PDT73969.1 hypothetical protein CO675_27715 [Bradyrhizobium sp. C9]
MIIIVGMYEWDQPLSRRRSSAPHDQHGAAAGRHVDDDRPGIGFGIVTGTIISSATSSSTTSGNTILASRSAPSD